MLIALLLLNCSILLSDAPANIASGDEAFFKIDYPAAVTVYESALQSNPDNAEILWRLARVYVCMGEVAIEEDQSQLLQAAVKYARLGILHDSTKAEAHTWLAGALGYLALNAETGEQVRLSNEVKNEVDWALSLDPRSDAAYSIKGSLYRAMGNLSWFKRQIALVLFGEIPDGGFEESETALKKAIEIAPDVMRHQYELAVLYLDWGRNEEARKILEHASTLPIRTAIDRPRLAKIQKFLSDLAHPAE